MMVRAATLASLIAFHSAAIAGVEFQPYEGRDVITEGLGGTRVSKHGIDYWTMGEPPRRYQVIGLITDVRKAARINGKAIGSETIAKKVLAAGGNAVIVQGVSTEQTGMAFVGSVAANLSRNTTRMLVVKYLP